MQYILYLLTLPFLYLNYKILVSDITRKKIPNIYLKYMCILALLWWLLLFLWFYPSIEIHPLPFFIQLIIALVCSFILYYFWIWAAGDAKYLLVLSFFIPYIWVIVLIGNIALITLSYLVGYFLYFYLGKITCNKNYREYLLQDIQRDITEKWQWYKKGKWWSTYKTISTFLLTFFIIFVSIRIGRNYFLEYILEYWSLYSIEEFIGTYSVYIIFWWIGVFLIWIYLIRLWVNKIARYIWKRWEIKRKTIWNISVWVLLACLLSFIGYELIYNYQEIVTLLLKIFTLYLIIFIVIKILIYSYKITFWIGETYYKDIDYLTQEDSIDKKYLLHITKDHKSKIDTFNIQNIEHIKWEIQKINKHIISDRNKKHKDGDTIKKIKILKTFSFWPYIFVWFIVTYIFEDRIINYMVLLLYEVLSTFIA